MQTTFSIAALIASASAINLGSNQAGQPGGMSGGAQDFIEYLATNGKEYSNSTEFAMREGLFAAANAFIMQANSESGNTAQYAHNFFSDMTTEEKQAMMGLIKGDDSDSESEPESEDSEPESDSEAPADAAQVEKRKKKNKQPQPAPASDAVPIDWRTLGAVNAIKNQGSCGSCYTFASNAQMEGLWQIKYGTLLSLAEQQLVDCSGNGNNGCNGGFMTNVFNYYSNVHAMVAEADYKYVSGNTGAAQGCQVGPDTNATAVMTQANGKTHKNWKANDWKTGLATGVISIGVAAGNNHFQHYTSGILNTDKCPNSIDHAVAMVGWGTDATSGQEFWIVRNSWGTSWGEAGYIRMATEASGNGVCMVQSTGVTVDMA